MRYQTSYHTTRHRRRTGPLLGTGAVLVLLIGVFVLSVYLFRKPDVKRADANAVNSIADVLTPTPLAFSGSTSSAQSKMAALASVSGSSDSGTATRGTKDGQYYFSIKAAFPDIDREAFAYEAWILRPIPYDYLSVGEMETNDDGEFVLEWSATSGKDYTAYTEVVITLEPKDGNPDPSGHVFEGAFE